MSVDRMNSLSTGSRLGPYEIVAPLGAGGMGEVFRARDTKLNRDAAIKVLPVAFAQDADRVARFRREAQLLASLNHPNIAAIYGLEEADGVVALALELVEGEDLAQRLTRGALPVDEAIAIARQVAEALEEAHEHGIVHRDLKPANIKITREGTVKLLDFGLAKAYQGDAATSNNGVSQSPTMSRQMTEAGIILGTAAYMSPEQARGKPVDKRSDVWSFGVVLFEMLTGKRLFNGETVSDVLAAVLTKQPDWSALPAGTPPSIGVLLRRCLRRDAKDRLRDIGEARFTLTHIGDSSATALVPVWRRTGPWAVLVAGVAVALALLLAVRPTSRVAPQQAPLLSLGIDAGVETPLAGVGWIGINWVGPTAILSPDGRLLVFIARGPNGGPWQLHTRRLDELKASPLAGTEAAYAPFFAPDGRSIGFFAGGQLKRIALGGGAVTSLCPVDEARGGAWSEDGSMVFAPRPDGPLFRVSANGGTPEAATRLASGERTHRWPQILPGGGLLYMSHETKVTSIQGASIVAQDNAGGEPRVIHRGGLYGRYVPSGHLLYVHDGKLFAAAFDVERHRLTGRGVPILDDVAHSRVNGGAHVSFSETGLLAYRRSRSRDRLLSWMDLAGQTRPLRNVPAEYLEVRFSRDGGRLALVIADGAQSDVWIYDIARDTMSRLTFDSDNDWTPIWSPDGSRIAYSSWRADVGTFNLFWHRADGTGEPERLTESKNQQFAVEWHPGGRLLLFSEFRRETGADLMLLPLEQGAKGEWKAGSPKPLLDGPANELAGEFSPDGRWLAYTSDESGRSEVYVQPFPGPGGRWQVSTEGAEWVEWGWGGELHYGRSEEVVMTVPYRVDGSSFRAEKPRLWMRIPPGVSWVEPHADGTRAAVIRSEDSRRESLVLMVNFFDYLHRTATAGTR